MAERTYADDQDYLNNIRRITFALETISATIAPSKPRTIPRLKAAEDVCYWAHAVRAAKTPEVVNTAVISLHKALDEYITLTKSTPPTPA